MTTNAILLGLFSILLAIAGSATPSVVNPQGHFETIFAAIIQGFFIVVAAIVAVIAKEMYANRSLKSLSSARRKAVTGTWEGSASNLSVAGDEPVTMEFTITFHLTAGRKKIKGTAAFHRDRDYEVDIKGGFHSESYLKLEYMHRQPIIGFGYIILRLDDEGREMSGKVVAYGAKSHKIVVGLVTAQKK